MSGPGPQALAALIAEIAESWPRGIALEPGDAACAAALYPVEEAAIARAVVARRAEFAGGRAAARAALARLGLPAVAIPMAEDRVPVWPEDVVGSITHAGAACLAVAARAGLCAGLGVDLEPLVPLEPGLRNEVSDAAERAALGGAPGLAALRLFSMKEAAYKAQYALSRTLFGFDTLRWDGAAGGLRFDRAVPPFAKGFVLPVRQWTGHGLCLSLTVLPAGASFSATGGRARIVARP